MEEVADVPYEGVVAWLLCRRLLPEDYHQRLKGERKKNTNEEKRQNIYIYIYTWTYVYATMYAFVNM